MTDDTTSPIQPEPSDPHAPLSLTAQDDQEAETLWWEGLPSDGVVLVPSVAVTPMRHPKDTWAMLVLAVDVLDDIDSDTDRDDQVVLFAGCWLPKQPPAALHEGDLVLMLTAPDGRSSSDDLVDVEMRLAHGNGWLCVGRWSRLDPRWPWTVAVTAAATLELHGEATEAGSTGSGATADRPVPGYGGLADLLAAGLVRPGDEFIWDRPGCGARHTARIHSSGTLVLANTLAYSNPSAALTALGGGHRNGWRMWRRTTDNRALDELRAKLHNAGR
ncbi:hypothetical protein [Saccharothrix obliqua]|uniref:restriction system modified-DNA reader domain-containing protein n=1 Tax=Saccharothrix obliqua TaxID=2861747 RepID=UPI001C5E77E8|nr:hypothetical protein [Saccharothrix obliqua]MBW4717353.1 hypothetical protein [Saccharothrix obliqua]